MMHQLTGAVLSAVMPQARIEGWLAPLASAMAEFDILPDLRAAAFLAQLAHESGELRYVRELWGPTAQQRRYDPPGALAARLGNTEPGDGFRFRGRGLIQITGRANYAACSNALLGSPRWLLQEPQRLAEPAMACRSAGWFWSSRGLNALADQGPSAFRTITWRINGGLNGLAEREAYYARALRALDIRVPSPVSSTPPSWR